MARRSAVFHRDLTAERPSIVRGQGLYLEDDAGRRYLDANASAGVVGVGHGRREIFDAMAEAGDRLSFVYSGSFTHPWQERLASAILSIAPASMGGVYFVSGGSEANETAIKLARQYHVERGNPQKHKLIARWQSYHGVTLATLSLSGRTSWRQIFSPYLIPVSHIAPPYAYRCAYCAERSGCTLACADELERAILLEGPDTVAAFFAETIVGTTATGLTPPPGYYERIAEICARHDVLFVADEVLCGYGRTGKPFAIQHWEAEPDIITMGKAIASGYAALGAVVVSQKIVDAFAAGSGRFVHGFTYSGIPASCFAGIKVFEIMQREALFDRPGAAGAKLLAGIQALAGKHDAIGEVRGRGLLIGVEFVADRRARTPFPKTFGFTGRLVRHLRAQGVIVSPGVALSNFGRDGDHIQISPPFIIDDAAITQILDALDAALSRTAAEASGA
jgi:adenosylmethionine-8-amino-7-oxononanoate aminotransferase